MAGAWRDGPHGPAPRPALSVPAAAQQTIHVPVEQPTIQAAIEAAAPGDTVLVCPGRYVEQIDFLGKAITVRSDAGPGVTTIDAAGGSAWIDYPYHPVVRMVDGEGPATRLEGFSVTGAGDRFGLGDGAGVWCAGLSPTIVGCRLVGNQGGPGLLGDATVEVCCIADSRNIGDGGGLHGRPCVRRTLVVENHAGGHGGGIFLTGPSLVEACVVRGNVAGNGFDGYSGGGVFGPAMLLRSLVVENTAHHYISPGPLDEIGSGVDGALWIGRCTIAANRIGNSAGHSPRPGGGVRDVGRITNSIPWRNEDAQVGALSTPVIEYSTVQDGCPGVGNLAQDPLFRNAARGDYFLSPGSPAIDAGDPAASADPDGTRADMGALCFPQFPARLAVRNGSGVNPTCYASTTLPVIGTTWSATVDATAHGFPASSSWIRTRACSPSVGRSRRAGWWRSRCRSPRTTPWAGGRSTARRSCSALARGRATRST